MSTSIRAQIEASRDAIAGLLDHTEAIEAICQACLASLKSDGKILTCGNGGSATDAMHLTEELVARYRSDRKALPSICLAADPSIMTCIGNDFGWDLVFARQVEAHGQPGDVLVVFTTSGQSENINRALKAAQKQGVTTVGLLGKGGGPSLALCDLAVVVPSDDTPRIQEAHALLLHLIGETVENHYA